MLQTKKLNFIFCFIICFYTLAFGKHDNQNISHCLFNSSSKIFNVFSKLLLSCFNNITNRMEAGINVTNSINESMTPSPSKTNSVLKLTCIILNYRNEFAKL